MEVNSNEDKCNQHLQYFITLVCLRPSFSCRTEPSGTIFYLFDCGDSVTACYGKTEVDARGQEELHGDLFPTLLLPHILQFAVNPRRHGAGRSSMGNRTAQSTQTHYCTNIHIM